MKRLTTIAAALLLMIPMPANAQQTFLACEATNAAGAKFRWNITLNEMASTVSMTDAARTVLGGFAPESVVWRLITGDKENVFQLNRLTGQVNTYALGYGRYGKWGKEQEKKFKASGLCTLRQAPTARKF